MHFVRYNQSMKNYTIIAIPGAGFGAGVYGELSRELAVKALSFPGHARGVAGPAPATIADMADIVRRRCAGLPAASVVLLGHSMGALVAMEAAPHEAVAGLVLVGAAARMPVNEALLAAARDEPETAFAMMLKWGVYRDLPRAEAVRGQLLSLLREAEGGVLYTDLLACNTYAGPEGSGKPLAILAGSHDKMTPPEEGKKLAGALGGAFTLIENCGHMTIAEQPAATALEIGKFINTLN